MREHKCIFTIDYETWQPIPAGCSIDWERDLIENAEKLMHTFEKVGVKLTFMVEMCELFWLYDNDIELALKVETQIKNMISRGHDVQLHLHPNWMPDCNVYTDGKRWEWNWEWASSETYPYDFSSLMVKCKEKLESIVREVQPNYTVKAYRAGAYRVQPFKKTYQALTNNGIKIDTSVYMGGKSKGRNYDFSKCKFFNRPYLASKDDPQISATASTVIELPITTWEKNQRLFIDNFEAEIFGERFLNLGSQFFCYDRNYFVFIGHSKGDRNYKKLEKQLITLKNYPGIQFVTISECFNEILTDACNKKNTMVESIQEVQEVMKYIYHTIEPNENANTGDCGRILREKKALCYGYSVLLYKILKQMGYKVKRITLYAKDMPNGRGKRKKDTHEVVELNMYGKRYILDATTNLVISHSVDELLKKPNLIGERFIKDSRYKQRNYYQYDSSFFYERVYAYTRSDIYEYGIENEGIKKRLVRTLKNIIMHIIPSKIKIYKIILK